MDNKDKKQLNIFKSVQPSKESKEKYFKVERGGPNLNSNKNNNNINPALNKKFDNNQDTTNYFFITNKKNINDIPQSKKGINKLIIIFFQQQIIEIKMAISI